MARVLLQMLANALCQSTARGERDCIRIITKPRWIMIALLFLGMLSPLSNTQLLFGGRMTWEKWQRQQKQRHDSQHYFDYLKRVLANNSNHEESSERHSFSPFNLEQLDLSTGGDGGVPCGQKKCFFRLLDQTNTTTTTSTRDIKSSNSKIEDKGDHDHFGYLVYFNNLEAAQYNMKNGETIPPITATTPATPQLIVLQQKAWENAQYLEQSYGMKSLLLEPLQLVNISKPMALQLSKSNLTQTYHPKKQEARKQDFFVPGKIAVQKVKTLPPKSFMFLGCKDEKLGHVLDHLEEFVSTIVAPPLSSSFFLSSSSSSSSKDVAKRMKQAFYSKFVEEWTRLKKILLVERCLVVDFQVLVDREGKLHNIDMDRCFSITTTSMIGWKQKLFSIFWRRKGFRYNYPIVISNKIKNNNDDNEEYPVVTMLEPSNYYLKKCFRNMDTIVEKAKEIIL